MRPALSLSTTSLTTAPSSTPSLNVPLLDPCGPSSILVSMIEEQTQPLWSSVHLRQAGRDPDDSLWTQATPLLVPLLSQWPCLMCPWTPNHLCLCRCVRIPQANWPQGHPQSVSNDLQHQDSCPMLLYHSLHEINYLHLAPKLTWIN